MKMLVHTKVGRRFLVTSILIFLPIAAAGFLGIKIAMDALRTQTHALLRTASDGAEAQVREFLVSLERTTESRAEEEAIKLPLLHPNQSNGDVGERLTHLQMRVPEAKEIFCLNMEGKVVASSTPAMLGKDLSSSTEFLHGQKTFEPGDILRDPATSAIYWRMSAPVRNSQTGQLLGVVVVGFDPAALSVLTAGKRALAQGAGTQSFRMGESGETYIVNKDGLLLTESRFAPGSALALKAKTAPVRAAIERGEEIIADYKDYRGVEVIGASAILADRGWVLMSEIDFSQASAPIRALRPLLLTITVLTLLMAGLI